MTTRDTSSDRSGASVFNTRGQRVNEIDPDEPRHGTTIDAMSAEDWRAAQTALLAFDARP